MNPRLRLRRCPSKNTTTTTSRESDAQRSSVNENRNQPQPAAPHLRRRRCGSRNPGRLTIESQRPGSLRLGRNPADGSRKSFVDWMIHNRGEDPGFLGQRWDRFQQLLAQRHIWDERDKRAFLLTPREEFVTSANLNRAYEDHYLPIGFGVTITDPQTVARMTNSMGVKFGDKVLEIGTGSGYQSAYLSNLTGMVWSIEIVKPLAQRTWALYDSLLRAATANTSPSGPGMPMAMTAGRRKPRSTRHCHVRHRPHSSAAAAATQARRHYGHPGGAAWCATSSEGRQGAGARRRDERCTLRYLQRPLGPFVPFTKLEGDVIKGTHRAR